MSWQIKRAPYYNKFTQYGNQGEPVTLNGVIDYVGINKMPRILGYRAMISPAYNSVGGLGATVDIYDIRTGTWVSKGASGQLGGMFDFLKKISFKNALPYLIGVGVGVGFMAIGGAGGLAKAGGALWTVVKGTGKAIYQGGKWIWKSGKETKVFSSEGEARKVMGSAVDEIKKAYNSATAEQKALVDTPINTGDVTGALEKETGESKWYDVGSWSPDKKMIVFGSLGAIALLTVVFIATSPKRKVLA